MLKGFLVVALALPVSPAYAGWGGIEWGVDRSEVATMRGEKPYKIEEGFDKYHGEVAGFQVNLSYKFADNYLVGIALSPVQESECARFKNSVRETYGQVFYKNDSTYSSVEKWADEGNGNLVTLFTFKVDQIVSCHVMYEPLPKPNTGGF